MDSGDLVTLLFWGVVIIFTLVQSYAQQRKQQQQRREAGEDGELGEGEEPGGWAAEKTAGDLVPADVWKEIENLARGEAPRSGSGVATVPDPEPSGATSPDDLQPEPSRTPSPAALERAERVRAAGDRTAARPVASLAKGPSEPSLRGRRLLGDLSGFELKRAVLLHEVLAPPVSERRKGRGGR